MSSHSSRSREKKGYQNVFTAKEVHKKEIYCGAWSDDIFEDGETGSDIQYFATCAGTCVTVYGLSTGTTPKTFVAQQGYKDPDDGEYFYACVFGGRSLGTPIGFGPIQDVKGNSDDPILLEEPPKKKRARSQEPANQQEFFHAILDVDSFDGPQLLCVAGKRGIVKVIDVARRMLFATLSGHGDDIYDLKFSPADEWLLLSASKDESLRLWNLKTTTCIAIFAGHEGHRSEVLAAGWHPTGSQFASGGMDTTVKIWSIAEHTNVYNGIKRSKLVTPNRWDAKVKAESKYLVVFDQMPIFSTNKVHLFYVDCVEYVGDFILSKDCMAFVVLWQPVFTKAKAKGGGKTPRLPCNLVALREFNTNCDIWFVRFGLSPDRNMFALGNTEGEIKIWDLTSPDPTKKHVHTLKQTSSCVRMVAFNFNAQFLISVCADSTVWVYECPV